MTELQFESLIACAEGEYIEKRVPKPRLRRPNIPHKDGNAKVEKPNGRLSGSKTGGKAVDMTESAGRRPSMSAPDIKHDGPS